MKRKIIATTGTVSFVLFVAVLVAWVSSYSQMERLSFNTPQAGIPNYRIMTRYVYSIGGAMEIGSEWTFQEKPVVQSDFNWRETVRDHLSPRQFPNVYWFHYDPPKYSWRPGMTDNRNNQRAFFDIWGLWIPYWLLAVLTGILPFWWMATRPRRPTPPANAPGVPGGGTAA